MKRRSSLFTLLLLAGCAQPTVPLASPTRNLLSIGPWQGSFKGTAKVPDTVLDVSVTPKRGKQAPGAAGANRRDLALTGTAVYHFSTVGDRDGFLAAARANPDVAIAEPDYPMHTTSLPNDPDIGYQWDVPKIDLQDAWNITSGNSQIIMASIDSGVNYNHPDLQGQVIKGENLIANSLDPMDDNGHGTHTAGTMAALTNNGIGVAGIASGCKILAIKAMDQNGSGSTSQIAEGVLYAVAHGAKVINMSLGGPYDSQTLHSAIQQAVAAGIVVVASAGNDGSTQMAYPAAYPEVLSVGATDQSDARASYSNYGNWVKIAAPGSMILSTYQNGYAYMDGTSMAAPHVAAVAALLLSQHPGWSVAQVSHDLEQSGDPVSGVWGNSAIRRLNAYKALQWNGTAPATPGPSAQPASPTPAQSSTPLPPTQTPVPTSAPTQAPRPTPTITPPPSQPPTLPSTPLYLDRILAIEVTQHSALMIWTSSYLTDGQVQFGLTPNLSLASAWVTPPSTTHAIALNNLQNGKLYYYRVVSHDANGQVVSSSIKGFRTRF